MNHRNLCRISIDHFKESIAKTSLVTNPKSEPALQYHTVLCDLLGLHASQRRHYITLHPHAPWFTGSLRGAKLERHCLECKWHSTALEVDCQLYRDHCVRCISSSPH